MEGPIQASSQPPQDDNKEIVGKKSDAEKIPAYLLWTTETMLSGQLHRMQHNSIHEANFIYLLRYAELMQDQSMYLTYPTELQRVYIML